MLNRPLLILFLCMVWPAVVFTQNSADTTNYYQRVISPSAPDHLPSGYFYYLNQAKMHLKNGDTLFAVDAQRLAIIAGYKLGTYTNAEQQAVTALKWLDAWSAKPQIKNSRYTGCYNLLGMIYGNKNHLQKAGEYYHRAMTYATTISDSIGLLNNRGNIYLKNNDLTAAAQDFNKAIALAQQQKDTVKWARALNNLGVLQLKQNYNKGTTTVQNALLLRENINDLEGIYSSNRHLALAALSQKDTLSAHRYATTTLHIAKELNSAAYMQESLSMLMDLNNDSLVSQYKSLTDSINRGKQEEQNRYAALQFDVEKEILNTQKAELELEKERHQKTFIIIIGLLLFSLLVLVIILVLSRIKRIRQQEIYKTESRISKKVHDELANDVYQLMVKMQVEQNKDEDVLDDLEAIYNKSRDISREYQVLDTHTSFDETLTDLLASYRSDAVNIIKRETSSVDWNAISEAKKNAIYRVLQELLTNMKKHSKATLVAVTIGQQRQKITINYSDNGVGTMLKKQNGLQNAENRIFALNGSITFESTPQKGFKAKIIV